MANHTILPEPRSAQEKLSTFRKRKVRKSYYYYQHCTTKPYHNHKFPPPVPLVEIKGYWLNQAGFTIDDPLSVEVRLGCIIIKHQMPPG